MLICAIFVFLFVHNLFIIRKSFTELCCMQTIISNSCSYALGIKADFDNFLEALQMSVNLFTNLCLFLL